MIVDALLKELIKEWEKTNPPLEPNSLVLLATPNLRARREAEGWKTIGQVTHRNETLTYMIKPPPPPPPPPTPPPKPIVVPRTGPTPRGGARK